MRQVYLKPGEIYFAEHSVVVYTVLGSCVSVTFFCRDPFFAAINHVMMPKPVNESGAEVSFKYVETSIEHMHKRFNSKGILPKQVEVKMFGGANMFHNSCSLTAKELIGQKNVAKAISMLSDLNYEIKAYDLGHDYGRKIFFYTDTGRVLMKRVNRIAANPCR